MVIALTKIPRGAGRKLVGNRVVGDTLDGVIVTADQVRKWGLIRFIVLDICQ